MPVPNVDSEQCSSQTLWRRTQHLSECRESVSGGCSQVLVRQEVQRLSKEDRQELLHNAGLSVEIGSSAGLAMKADLALSWSKLREIWRYANLKLYMFNYGIQDCVLKLWPRWLKESGVVLAGDKKQRALANTLLGDNLEAEAEPMPFPLKGGGEEVRARPFAYVPDVTEKVLQTL